MRSVPSQAEVHVTNRPAIATSPYLLQHADNPVEWWEWKPAALGRRGGATFRSW